jgi:plastocyanin
VLSRRAFVTIGGGGLVAAALSAGRAAAENFEIAMRGNSDGSKVWFDPAGLLVPPGSSIRWVNRDPGNAHTSTAFHPANDGHELRIPPAATPWNSDYLLPDQAFTLTLAAPGIYDYFCIPHEMAGMVGRIVVLAPGTPSPPAPPALTLPGTTSDLFPSVADIVRNGRIPGN